MRSNSKWIWPVEAASQDQYAEFYQPFSFSGQRAELLISVDSNYAVYVNGQLAETDQYPDYKDYKIFDFVDLSAYCKPGINHLAIVVWYYGISNMSYIPGKAALRYELWQDDQLICRSDEHTLSRISRTFHNGLKKTISGQLGLSYWYDLSEEDDWMTGAGTQLKPGCVVEQTLPLFPRPVSKCKIMAFEAAELIRADDDVHFLFDIGRESVGYLEFDICSETRQKMTVCYGEHIADGGVRRLIGERDFSVEYTLRPGRNLNLNPFRRLGLRYLEVFCERPVQIHQIGIRPTVYPVNRITKRFRSPLRQRIYDVAVRTLELCMHDHYEDTPWREQALYAMDSRNQMLCGYYAFEEYAFPRANLLLMSKSNRTDGLLSICFPNNDPLTIPSFSLHYFTEVYEYTRYSGDKTLAEEIYPRLKALMQAFLDRVEDDWLPNWQEKQYWNFYEWSPGLSGALLEETKRCYDAALNCLLVIALMRLHELGQMLDIQDNYAGIAARVRRSIRKRFFDEECGAFVNSTADRGKSALVNALAILCGAVAEEEAEKLAEKLADGNNGWTPATLSMICFQYDALLMVDKERYSGLILRDIDAKYSKMLDAGATSFWETEKGEADFGGAGSMCHAWSSMPVYYYHLLNA